MAIEIVVLGLNETGASIAKILTGMGEAVLVTGYDHDHALARTARKVGTVTRIAMRPEKAVGDADVVFMCLPVSHVKDMLTVIGPELKEDVIIIDTSWLKGNLFGEWTANLPPNRHFVGATPGISPQAMIGAPAAAGEGNTELFKGGVMAMVFAPGTPEDKVEMVMKLVRMLGADPFFVDAGEVDGVMASVEALPAIMSMALVEMVSGLNGWKESQRMAGRAFNAVAGPLKELESDVFAADLNLNQQNVLYRLDAVMARLQELRRLVADGNEEELAQRLDKVQVAYKDWLQIRTAANWDNRQGGRIELPKGGMLATLFGVNLDRGKKS